jgi:hypothetical protein
VSETAVAMLIRELVVSEAEVFAVSIVMGYPKIYGFLREKP